MTDSRDRGISQSPFENPGPYIPRRTAHTDCLIRTDIITEVNSFTGSATIEEISGHENFMFWFYIIILSSHYFILLFSPWAFSTALASSGCMKTAVLYFSVWPSHPVTKPLLLPD